MNQGTPPGQAFSNTWIRIFSGVFLGAVVLLCLKAGRLPFYFLTQFLAFLLQDEWLVNFCQKTRRSKPYLISQAVLLANGAYFYYTISLGQSFQSLMTSGFNQVLVGGACLSNLLLLAYLFTFRMGDMRARNWAKHFPYFGWALFMLPMHSFAMILSFENWQALFVGLILIAVSMDTGAYFTGLKLGKNKLWPEVSPKKTIEGLFGGLVVALIVASVYWKLALDQMSLGLSIALMFLAFCSQIGDLIQSKIKRQFALKDSSALIPGHGGVYDRLDSLLFIAPVFVLVLMIYY